MAHIALFFFCFIFAVGQFALAVANRGTFVSYIWTISAIVAASSAALNLYFIVKGLV